MTDWSKLKVTELKEELKAREVPLTGLKLKQQFIDKLIEYEANQGKDPGKSIADVEVQERQDGAESPKQPEIPQINGNENEIETENESKSKSKSKKEGHHPPKDVDETDENLEGKPEVEINKGVSSVQETAGSHVDPAKADQPHATQLEPPERLEALAGEEHEITNTEPKTHTTTDTSRLIATADGNKSENLQDAQRNRSNQTTNDDQPLSVSHGLEQISSSPSTPNLIPATEDQRKRKRRSVTPVPSSAEIAMKKAKANDGTPIVIQSERLEDNVGVHSIESKADEPKSPVSKADIVIGSEELISAPDHEMIDLSNTQNMEKAESMTDVSGQNVNADKPMVTHKAEREVEPKSASIRSSPKQQSKLQSIESHTTRSRFTPPHDLSESSTSPAIHPATSSLYMKNFKRPLHIPTLRNHIEKLARRTSDEDAIKIFYLDSIRTHGFVTFASISSASRVRSAMHGKKFPDEPIREPIFIDFIPDDQVQNWIDQERQSSNRRYEVIYNQTEDGVEAILQDESSKLQPKPQPTKSTSVVHPDRAVLIPKELSQPKQSNGTGFKALDELFSFTTAKPKLYFKSVPTEVSTQRLSMIRNLHLGYTEMGKSGDEGMKRYTFEGYRNRQEWIDKGPEFGYGRKGQDRLIGIRGRPVRGGFRGDTWRH